MLVGRNALSRQAEGFKLKWTIAAEVVLFNLLKWAAVF
jgi:hypothetical protein